MALNIAVPLSGVGGLSPISPIGIDCWENIKILVSPIGSESSGVSSLDSEEAKSQQPQKPENMSTPKKIPAVDKAKRGEYLRVVFDGRDILELGNNIAIPTPPNSNIWNNFCYTRLPENNLPTYLINRSQYHRLGPQGLTPAYSLMKCECCDFQYITDKTSEFYCQTSLHMSTKTTADTMTYSSAVGGATAAITAPSNAVGYRNYNTNNLNYQNNLLHNILSHTPNPKDLENIILCAAD